MAGRTLYRMFRETVRQHGGRRAVGFKTSREGAYTFWTYLELEQRVRSFRRGLDALGLRKGDSLALISHENRVEWAVADLAAQSLGLITVPIYGSLPSGQVAYFLKDSGARAIVVADARQRTKIDTLRSELPLLETVITMDCPARDNAESLSQDHPLSFCDVIDRGIAQGREEAVLEAIEESVAQEDVATLIYTSGTTGEPKGAMLSHRNLLQTPDGVVEGKVADVGCEDVFLSFLPLSHITERVGGHYLPLRLGACIVYSQGLTAFREELTQTVRPTVLPCVPRLWESIHQKFLDGVAKMPDHRRKLVNWSVRVGIERAERRSAGQPVGFLLTLKHRAAEKLVLQKIREQLTGGKMRFPLSGGAPLDPETTRFYLAIGIEMLEGYGLSETSIMAINRPGKQRIGTVGTLLPNVEVKLAPDGEILMRGQGRMVGYFNRPDATTEAIDAEGWFHTGDIGTRSVDGYLQITDRKKDILVLSNGKKVAPQPIESILKRSPYIGEAVLFCDSYSTVIALIVPHFELLLEWAKTKGLSLDDKAVLLATPEVQKLYKSEVDRLTSDLADFEKVKRFKLVDRPFGIDSGELTPTLKVKRKFVAQKYADLVAAMSRG